jgi:hypothetical protein
MRMTRIQILIAVAVSSALMGVAAQRARAQNAQPAAQEKTAPSQDKPAAQEQKPGSDAESADKLRKESQNPIASLISVPIQENWNFHIGPADRTQNIMNIQPVIPMTLGTNWNLIVRWIAPVIYQPVGVQEPPPPSGPDVSFISRQAGTAATTQSGVYGLGDMQPTFFFSPKKSKVTWGAGPILLLPTATKTGVLGQGKFGMGPALVSLVQPGKWTFGFLTNNVWSVAGHSNLPDVNQFLLEYFINYNLQKGWYLTWNPTLTANWEATNGGRWVVPFGGGVGRIMKLGTQPATSDFSSTVTLSIRPADRLGV